MALLLFLGTTFQSPPKSDGTVNSGGKVYFYEPGTTTPKNTYTTSDLSVANANPLVLDSNGRGTAWLNGSYYIKVTDSSGTLIDEEDNYNKGNTFDLTAVTATRTMAGVDDTGRFTHSGTYTVHFPQASTLGSGWSTEHYNIGTGNITFTRDAAGDTIDGSAADVTLYPGQRFSMTVNGGATGYVTNISHGPNNYATASGTDTYTATLSPPIPGYVTGATYSITFTNANTSTTPTLNLNGLGAKTIVKTGTTALAAGDISAGMKCDLLYDGTYFVLRNPYVVTFGRLIRTEVTGTSSVSLGTVNSGDRILVTAAQQFSTTGSGGYAYADVAKSAGTATVVLPSTALRNYFSPVAAQSFYITVSGIIQVTVTGTLTLTLSAAGNGTTGLSFPGSGINAIVLNNG